MIILDKGQHDNMTNRKYDKCIVFHKTLPKFKMKKLTNCKTEKDEISHKECIFCKK